MQKNYKFTESWFDIAIPVWERVFEKYDNIENILEVGCYEGKATTWICDNVIKGRNATYDIVDTFGGTLTESGMVGTLNRLKEDNFIESNFMHNISFHPNVNFKIHKGYSQIILPTLPQKEVYDFIYIDASHRADDTFVDAYYAHKMLKSGGLLIFDDFGWKDPQNMHPVNSPQLGIEVFNTMYDNNYVLIFKGYQVGFIKK
jgi:hypothetical protein